MKETGSVISGVDLIYLVVDGTQPFTKGDAFQLDMFFTDAYDEETVKSGDKEEKRIVMDDLYTWFASEKITISEDDDIEELEDNDIDLLDEDDGSGTDETEEETEETAVAAVPASRIPDSVYTESSNVHLNDPVKMYLKEIGRVPLLKPEDEPEIAKRIEQGDEEAKNILISSNLRLVVSIAKKYVGRGMDADSFHNGLGRSEIGKVFD